MGLGRGAKRKNTLIDQPLLQEESRSWIQSTGAVDAADPSTKSSLPIRTKGGRWKAMVGRKEASKASNLDRPEGIDSSKVDMGAATVGANASGMGTDDLEDAKPFEQVKLELASIAIEITEDPSGNYGKLKSLHPFLDHKQSNIAILALLTYFAVLKDILPGYQIREHKKDEEAESHISADVKAMRKQDQTILAAYVDLLKRLRDSLESKNNVLIRAAAQCFGELGLVASHFNHYDKIIDTLIMLILGQEKVTAELAHNALVEILQKDVYGYATWLALKRASDLIKKRGYNAPVSFLSILLEAVNIKIGSEINPIKLKPDGPRNKKAKVHLSKKERKEHKQRLALTQKISEAEVTISISEQTRWADESRRHLFRIYFGIFKAIQSWNQEQLRNDNNSQVLILTMEGLVKFAHLIGAEHFSDLLNLLRGMLTRPPERELLTKVGLQCILTTAKIQTLIDSLSTVDFRFLHIYLYRQLGKFIPSNKGKKQDDSIDEAGRNLLSKCFQTLLGPKKLVPHVRLAAFAQRLADIANHALNVDTGAFALGLLDSLINDHPRLVSLFDKETFGQGSYLQNAVDPDLSNPFSRTLHLPPTQTYPLVGRIMRTVKQQSGAI